MMATATRSFVTSIWSGYNANNAYASNAVGGEKVFIDYCGPTVPIVNPHTGEFMLMVYCAFDRDGW